MNETNTRLGDQISADVNDYIISADLGGTHLRAASVDADGRIHHRTKGRTPRTEDAADIVRAMIEQIHECGEQVVAGGGRVRALSIAVPGSVDAHTGLVIKTPNVPSLIGFELGQALEGAAGLPVILENDANAAAIGEMWQGAGRGKRTMLMITLGTGVGGGVILDGKLWRGAHGVGGELGHICVEAAGHPCPCGSRGCLEVYASATAIVRMARELGMAGGELTSQCVYEAAGAGDLQARETFRRMGTYLGIGLASLTSVFDEELIVIGGGVVAGWDLFIEHAKRELGTRAFAEVGRHTPIVQATCGDDAGILGAAYLAFTNAR